MTDEWRIRRRFPMTAWVDVAVKAADAMRRGYVINISREGVGLYYLGTVGAGTDVELTMHMLGPTGIEIVEAVQGRVMWENPWGGITIMGIQFKEPLGTGAPTIMDRIVMAERLEGNPTQGTAVQTWSQALRPIGESPEPGDDDVPTHSA